MESETVNRHQVAELFFDVPKWEHDTDGSLRIKYPENPVLPQVEEQIAAAEKVDEPDDEVTESLKLGRKLPRGRSAGPEPV